MKTARGIMTRTTSPSSLEASLELPSHKVKHKFEKARLTGYDKVWKETITSKTLDASGQKFLASLTSNRVDALVASRPVKHHEVPHGDTRRRVRARCVEGVLYRLLKRVPPETRLAVISTCFSQQQRLALESWIVSQRTSPPHLRAEEPRFVWHSPSGAAIAALRGRTPSLQRNSARVKSPVYLSEESLPVGISRRVSKGLIYFGVERAAGPFRLFAKSTRDISEAFQRHRVLTFFQSHFSSVAPSTSCHSAEEVDRAFRKALSDLFSEYGEEFLRKMAIRFAATVPAKLWVGRSLSTPRYEVMNSISVDIGLRAWRRLTECRGFIHRGRMNRYSVVANHNPSQLTAAWNQLKMVYTDIWTSAGRSQASIEKQFAELEARRFHFHHRLRDRWLLLHLRRQRRAKPSSDTESCDSSSKTRGSSVKRTSSNPLVVHQEHKKRKLAPGFLITSASGGALELSVDSRNGDLANIFRSAGGSPSDADNNRKMATLSSSVFAGASALLSKDCRHLPGLDFTQNDTATVGSSDYCKIKTDTTPDTRDRMLKSCNLFLGDAGYLTVKKIQDLLSQWAHSKKRSRKTPLLANECH